MKTKTFFLICLLSGICLTQLYSQGNQTSSDTRSYSYWMPVPWYFPAYCDGELVDYLSGTMEAHGSEHFVDGVSVFLIGQIKGEVTSELTGEVFKLNEIVKLFIPDPSVWMWSWTNLRGNKGTHYIAHGTYYPDGSFTVDKSVCVENGKK